MRRVLSGEFVFINKHLLKDLINLNIWNEDLRHRLVAEKGSVQNIEEIPQEIRDRYRTVWEIPQRNIIDMAADRGAFICQSQSLNIHMAGQLQINDCVTFSCMEARIEDWYVLPSQYTSG